MEFPALNLVVAKKEDPWNGFLSLQECRVFVPSKNPVEPQASCEVPVWCSCSLVWRSWWVIGNQKEMLRPPNRLVLTTALLGWPPSEEMRTFLLARQSYPSPPSDINCPVNNTNSRLLVRKISSLSTRMSLLSGPSFWLSSSNHILWTRWPDGFLLSQETRNPDIAGKHLQTWCEGVDCILIIRWLALLPEANGQDPIPSHWKDQQQWSRWQQEDQDMAKRS